MAYFPQFRTCRGDYRNDRQRGPVAVLIAAGIESAERSPRAFIAKTGTTPSNAIERLRIEVARQRVQSSTEAIERVAQLTGFRDPERMRRAFIRAFGQPPQSLRRAAGRSDKEIG
jgi:transcriptional regulator GlxA family with amidase domain